MSATRRAPRTTIRPVITAALAVLAVLLPGCAHQVGSGGRFGVVYLDAQGYYAGVKAGLQAESKELGSDPQLLELNAQGDASAESSFVDTVTSAAVDVLVLSPVSATASIPAVELAHDSGIPVVCYNSCIEDSAARKYVDAFVLGDPVAFGAISGDALAAHFQQAGIADPQVAVVNCEFVEVCVQRREGFEQALRAKVPGVQIVANQEGATIDEAVDVAERLLTAHPDLDAFYGEAGGATMGAVRAVEARGAVGRTVVVGGDMSTEAADSLAEGTVLVNVADISGIEVGRLAARAADDARRGVAPADFVIPAPVRGYGPGDADEWKTDHPDGVP